MRSWLCLLTYVLVGCGSEVATPNEEDSDSSSGSETTMLATTAPATSMSATTMSTGTTMQVDTSTGSGTDTGAACGEVDVLFVVDNSASMQSEQGRLDTAVPGFLNELYAITGSVDPHVMVVDVDAWVFEECDFFCSMFGECLSWEDFECDVTQPLECEDVLGAGIVHPRGDEASNEDCGFKSGGRYIDSSQPDMTAAVQCAVKVGIGSSALLETPMQSMVEAIDAMGDTAACNEGFLRDDAKLVIVFVTDEDDDELDSAGDPLGWHSRIVGAKGGVADDVFVLGLFGDNNEPDAICVESKIPNENAEPSPRLEQFVELWDDHGTWGSVCAGSYGDSFDELLAAVDSSC